MSAPLSIGLFVGGGSTRMGGVAKGQLLAPDGSGTLIERLLRISTAAAPQATRYLVGSAGPYVALGIPALQDEPANVGPIGGLRSLLMRAHAAGSPAALALACDLPFLDETVLSALLAPLGAAAARVPFADGRFQPLAAAYAPLPTLAAIERALASGKHALMHVLDQLGTSVERVEFSAQEALTLRDWDTPEDMQRH